MGFLAMNAFIGFAEGKDVGFNAFDKIEYDSLLMVAGMKADRAEFSYFHQSFIKSGNVRTTHY
jgi:hypothetical protein